MVGKYVISYIWLHVQRLENMHCVAIRNCMPSRRHHKCIWKHSPIFHWSIMKTRAAETLKVFQTIWLKWWKWREKGQGFKVLTDQVTFTRKANDYDKGSGERARGSGLALDTVPLRSEEHGTLRNKRDFSSKEYDRDECSSAVEVQRAPTVSISICATPIKHFSFPQVWKLSLTPNAGVKVWKHFDSPPNLYRQHVKNCKTIYRDCHKWLAGLASCGTHTYGKKFLNILIPNLPNILTEVTIPLTRTLLHIMCATTTPSLQLTALLQTSRRRLYLTQGLPKRCSRCTGDLKLRFSWTQSKLSTWSSHLVCMRLWTMFTYSCQN